MQMSRGSNTLRVRAALAATTSLLLAACGGGGSSDPASAAPPTEAARIDAATRTAQTNALCVAVQPFYWEIGDQAQAHAFGSVGGSSYTASTRMAIASASKWIYGAYVLEKTAGAPSAADIKFLTFQSGYSTMKSASCAFASTVDDCLATGTNGSYSTATDGKFSYDGGHMQKHASLAGLGALDDAGLAAEVQSRIGDFGFTYSQPQPAGGVAATPAQYAAFLRKMLAGQLQIAAQLGSHAVCTNPATCTSADYTPVPANESWHYSLGHWVEDDPMVGDGAFSSAGAFGFYPWIDRTRSWYGILARHAFQVGGGEGMDSAQCGRLIRKAWVTGVAQ